MTDESRSSAGSSTQWADNRTTFQRVYDILAGTTDPASAQSFSEWADCSENGARQALDQLTEMGIATRTGSRPARYRRNPSYFRWKRIENLAGEHSVSDLRTRLAELIETDEGFQTQYGVPTPDAVDSPADPTEDHETVQERWENLSEWRTVRRDITLVKRAVDRAESPTDSHVPV